ncbi:hypothetical protein A2303_04860 [Candidatus Falkowbacteria bacterium RIFOXYB2_FULL_47_14]|uniref:Uncharacterized protein n=1 Tax=Candidatus Falkowbacteria bacterium RIFOXYA2_FULL_47_19 TaxID=1797994 RepID=A0A1F5SHJ8_9BACT|nr:MAG: hypothetical protein A2227_02695 [Candidatus Falkowbacteria bacterium RIFOXYA2_FULL_47_19]OGF35831.1 MAG: hypothetical protein A2468_03880 [Candidatus Falkowbacteria bacterium RIFOXYC2_FULL_46_15]OGF42705.1 MAG: hypothetical protein A2303_04860 [Candidatus Falkowbacteria bacterium RIFOXYB2_FULL_47_14]
MNQIINQLLSHPWTIKILDYPCASYLYDLDSKQIWIIILITAALVLLMVYRKLGSGAFFGLILVFILAYIVYSSDIYGRWSEHNEAEQKNLERLQEEVEK